MPLRFRGRRWGTRPDSTARLLPPPHPHPHPPHPGGSSRSSPSPTQQFVRAKHALPPLLPLFFNHHPKARRHYRAAGPPVPEPTNTHTRMCVCMCACVFCLTRAGHAPKTQRERNGWGEMGRGGWRERERERERRSSAAYPGAVLAVQFGRQAGRWGRDGVVCGRQGTETRDEAQQTKCECVQRRRKERERDKTTTTTPFPLLTDGRAPTAHPARPRRVSPAARLPAGTRPPCARPARPSGGPAGRTPSRAPPAPRPGP